MKTDPYITERLLTGRNESNQTNKQYLALIFASLFLVHVFTYLKVSLSLRSLLYSDISVIFFIESGGKMVLSHNAIMCIT